MLPERDLNKQALQQYLKNGTGPFATTFLRGNALIVSSRAEAEGEGNWPDIQVMLASNGVTRTQAADMSRIYNLRDDLMKSFYNPVSDRDGFFFLVDTGRPRSRGVIKLRSTNYLDEPLIDPRYYSDPHDVQVTLEGIKRVVHMVENAPAYRKIGARLSPVPFPSCKNVPFKSDKYWECIMRHLTLTVHHFAGTNSMGRADSSNAVLDSELRVRGVHGLRVMDASAMPFVVTTNSNAASMVIAERGTEFMLEEYGQGRQGHGSRNRFQFH